MDRRDRQRIKSYEDLLIEKTDFKQVYTLLLRRGVIPARLKSFENVTSRTDRENNKVLYKVIQERGQTAFQHLQKALQISSPELFEQFEGKKWRLSGEDWHCSALVYDIGDAEIRGAYRIVTFTNDRAGWKKEKETLINTFECLDFEGSSNVDPDEKALDHLLDDFTSIKNAGCYIFALSGHGGWSHRGEYFIKKSGKIKLVQDIILKICKAPALLNKPKIIILQLCRGDQESISFQNEIATSKDTPDIKDTIILRPSLPGHVAYRDTNLGGWFIQELTKMIEQHARTKDIQQIMIEGYYKYLHESKYMVPCAYTYSFKKFYFVTEKERLL